MNTWHRVAAVAFLTTLIAVPVARSWALRVGVMDVPNSRSSHVVPKPRIGGFGVLCGVLAGLLAIYLTAYESIAQPDVLLVLALFFLAGIGLVDDIKSLPIWIRMPLYLLGATVISWKCARIESVDLYIADRFSLSAGLSLGFTTLFIGWYTNLFNFMDGIDGIAACAATVTTSALALVFSANSEDVILCLISISIASASLGFLPFNYSPSSVFMGDIGSVFLGGACGSLTAVAIQRGRLSLLAGILLMFPFVFDATFTLFRRALKGEKVWQAHRSHIYQQLCDLGFSHRAVATCYTGAAVATASFGLAFDQMPAAGQLFGGVAVLGSAGITARVVLAKNVQRALEST